MTFDEAKAYRLWFGKYSGRTLDDVAESDEGLRYLDWLVDEGNVYGPLKDALTTYLADPNISDELESIT